MQAISYKFILIPLLLSLLYFNPNPVVTTTTSFHDKWPMSTACSLQEEGNKEELKQFEYLTLVLIIFSLFKVHFDKKSISVQTLI